MWMLERVRGSAQLCDYCNLQLLYHAELVFQAERPS